MSQVKICGEYDACSTWECWAWQKPAVQAMPRNLRGLVIQPHSTHLPSKYSYKHRRWEGSLYLRVYTRESSVSIGAKQFHSAYFGSIALTIWLICLIILQINITWWSESLFILEVDSCYSKRLLEILWKLFEVSGLPRVWSWNIPGLRIQ